MTEAMAAPKKYLTRDLILAALDLPTADVECPEWGGVVKVRAMTGAERDAFEAAMVVVDEKKEDRRVKMLNLRARLCAQVIVGEDGVSAIFSEKDVEELGKKSAKALNRVFNTARYLSGFSEKDVEELEGK